MSLLKYAFACVALAGCGAAFTYEITDRRDAQVSPETVWVVVIRSRADAERLPTAIALIDVAPNQRTTDRSQGFNVAVAGRGGRSIANVVVEGEVTPEIEARLRARAARDGGNVVALVAVNGGYRGKVFVLREVRPRRDAASELSQSLGCEERGFTRVQESPFEGATASELAAESCPCIEIALEPTTDWYEGTARAQADFASSEYEARMTLIDAGRERIGSIRTAWEELPCTVAPSTARLSVPFEGPALARWYTRRANVAQIEAQRAAWRNEAASMRAAHEAWNRRRDAVCAECADIRRSCSDVSWCGPLIDCMDAAWRRLGGDMDNRPGPSGC